MPTRKAHARWEGTNPEELLGAAHADATAAAKAGCLVSQALAGTEITLEARLAK